MTKNLESGDERAPQVYELGYHVVPTVPESDVPAETAKVKEVLSSHGASVIAEEAPRLVDLSYRMEKRRGGTIDKFTSAHFGWVKFDVSGSEAKGILAGVERVPSVLRALLIRTVRESTLAPRRFSAPARDTEAPRAPRRAPREAKPAPVATDAELDRTIEELVK